MNEGPLAEVAIKAHTAHQVGMFEGWGILLRHVAAVVFVIVEIFDVAERDRRGPYRRYLLKWMPIIYG
jgi:hypothetical protein